MKKSNEKIIKKENTEYIENGNYSLETWYKLVKVSLPSRYHKLLDEILK